MERMILKLISVIIDNGKSAALEGLRYLFFKQCAAAVQTAPLTLT